MLAYQGSRLRIDGCDAEQLAQALGTPCFVISERRLLDNHRAIAEGFRDAGVEARVRYRADANAEPEVLRTLCAGGAQVVVSHAAHAERALAAGFPARRVGYQQPLLTACEVERAWAAGVRHFHVHHNGDIETLCAAAAAAGEHARVTLHLSDDATLARLSPLRLWSPRLGLDAAEAMVAARRVCASRELTLAGLSFDLRAPQEKPADYEPMLRRALHLACRIERELSRSVCEIDLGGGFPSASLQPLRLRDRLAPLSVAAPTGSEPGQLRAFARDVARRYAALAERRGPSRIPTLVTEPGRAIAGNAVVLLTRVQRITGRWAHVDLSRDWLPLSTPWHARAILSARSPASPATRVLHLAGATRAADDVLELLRRLPADLEAGDLLAFADSGAYSVTRARRDACQAPAIHLLPDAERARQRAATRKRRPRRDTPAAAYAL